MLARLTNMNKYDRRHLHAASLRCCSTVQTAMNEYEAVIKLLLSREREKRDKAFHDGVVRLTDIEKDYGKAGNHEESL